MECNEGKMKKDPHLERNTLIKYDKTNDKEKESNKTFQRKKYITCKKEAELDWLQYSRQIYQMVKGKGMMSSKFQAKQND